MCFVGEEYVILRNPCLTKMCSTVLNSLAEIFLRMSSQILSYPTHKIPAQSYQKHISKRLPKISWQSENVPLHNNKKKKWKIANAQKSLKTHAFFRISGQVSLLNLYCLKILYRIIRNGSSKAIHTSQKKKKKKEMWDGNSKQQNPRPENCKFHTQCLAYQLRPCVPRPPPPPPPSS